jgi:hypothetical protein
MKKLFLFTLMILTACAPARPQVTVTSPPPTAVDTPIPTPTLHPEIIALQTQISASGERFTLNPDGTVYDGAVSIPRLRVASDGVMTLMVDGEVILLDPSKAVFDDETGFSYPGYELYLNGEWVEMVTADTTVIGGVTLTLGEADENGVQVVTNMEVDGNYTEAQIADKMEAVDPANWGFDSGDTEVVKIDSKMYVTPEGDHDMRIAEWQNGTSEWLWDWEVLEGLEGENPIFKIAKTWEMNGVNEIDRDGAVLDDGLIDSFADTDPTTVGRGLYNRAIYIQGESESEVIGAVLKSPDKEGMNSVIAASGSVRGYIYFLDKKDKPRRFFVDHLVFTIRYWR